MPTTATSARPDATCAAAVDLAAAAARAEGGDGVTEHLGVRAEGDRVVTHLFGTTLPGYSGWRWAVTVVRASRSKLVTVDEVVLLPGEDALLAPEWVPWSERLRPGDLGVGDLLPTTADDDRLVPAYLLSDDPAVESVAFELGLGRARVMSKLGRDDAAERWYAGEGGPDTAMAAHAPGRCGTCGFYLMIEGSLRTLFGVCGNALSPRDASVVSTDAGCGAHSETLLEPPAPTPPPLPAYDDGDDIEQRPAPTPGVPVLTTEPATPAPAEPAAGPAAESAEDSAPAEDFPPGEAAAPAADPAPAEAAAGPASEAVAPAGEPAEPVAGPAAGSEEPSAGEPAAGSAGSGEPGIAPGSPNSA